MNRGLRDRLAALEQSTGRGSVPTHSAPPLERISPQTDWGLEELGFCFVPRHSDWAGDGFWRRTLRYDILTRHGSGRFADILQTAIAPLLRAARIDSEMTPSGPDAWIAGLRFYDTETSGLGSGAGTFPFLHAVGYIDGDEFVLEQYFLAQHGQEDALLTDLWARHFAPSGATIVSFNGKSFDWPLLKNRLVLHRIAAESGLSHVDLLPISRRLWKAKLARLSLSNIEEHVLGLIRTDDLPGSEAPARYFAYADSQDVALLRPVFDHNAMDVSSLVILTAHVADLLSHTKPVDSAREYLALARWHDEWGESDLARVCYRAANAMPDSDWQTLWSEALHYKRRHDWDAAAGIWEAMAERFPWTVPPLIELAKYAEHQQKTLTQARRWTCEAIQRAAQARRLLGHSQLHQSADAAQDPELVSLRHRLARIERKLQV